MTAVNMMPDIGERADDTLLEGLDLSSRTEAFSGVRAAPPEKQHGEVEEGATAKKYNRRISGPQVHPPPKKEYGFQWNWDPEAKDYTRQIDGITVGYREYQRTGGITLSRNKTPSSTNDPSQAKQEAGEGESSKQKAPADMQAESTTAAALAAEEDIGGEYAEVSRNPEAESVPSTRQNSISGPITPQKPLKEYQHDIDDGFTMVDKPRRFFQVGRIFSVVWFEPGGDNPPGRKADLEWTTDCPKYHGEKPIPKYRWFVVVRKRLHHSLCFNITTIGPKGPRKADRGRGQDFVVLHNSSVEPPKPFEVEGITRSPIAVIIEAGEESISPWARLDSGRIYTVEDHLRVMKIGRIHTASLPLLKTYFKESVL
ncbi:hypothetical protein V8F06_012702 [Rhypophila decipiens]